MPTVRFEPFAVTVDVPEGTPLMAAADQAAQQYPDEFFVGECCEGRLECGNCALEIVEGAENLSPASAKETELLKTIGAADAMRASCVALVRGDVVARVPERRTHQE